MVRLQAGNIYIQMHTHIYVYVYIYRDRSLTLVIYVCIMPVQIYADVDMYTYASLVHEDFRKSQRIMLEIQCKTPLSQASQMVSTFFQFPVPDSGIMLRIVCECCFETDCPTTKRFGMTGLSFFCPLHKLPTVVAILLVKKIHPQTIPKWDAPCSKYQSI